jgi:hypothetical protein
MNYFCNVIFYLVLNLGVELAEDRGSEAGTCRSDIHLRFNLHIKCALFSVTNEKFK